LGGNGPPVADCNEPHLFLLLLLPLFLAFCLAFSLMAVYSAVMKVSEEVLRSDPRVERLLKNPNWKVAADAAIAYLVRGTDCPINSWKKSSTWAQVDMVAKELSSKSRW